MRGDLVIVGGAEILQRHAIMARFVELAGGPGGRFVILPAATGLPLSRFEEVCAWFAEAGVSEASVELLAVSAKLPGGEAGAWSEKTLEQVRRADGLWMLGGDQNEILRLLLSPERRESPLLSLMRERSLLPHAEGGLVLGGTSAGAAVMSDPSIGGGTSYGALSLPRAGAAAGTEMSGALLVVPGLGFFPDGLVDQHFDRRSRFARLAMAALEEGRGRLAFGIAEATALVYRGAERALEVVGAGGVYVIDARAAQIAARPGSPREIRGLRFHYLTQGDRLEFESGRVDFGLKRELAPGDEAFAFSKPLASGPLSPYPELADFAARMLLDNDPWVLEADASATRRFVRALLVEDGRPSGEAEGLSGWELRLSRRWPLAEAGGELRLPSPHEELPPARLFYDGRYSFINVEAELLPLEISIRYR